MPWVRLKQATETPAFNKTVTHGDQLVINDVGPWALQQVTKGTEAYQALTGPGRGYWRFDVPDEFAPTANWPSNANDSNLSILNDPNLHGGVVAGSPVTIDGFSIPVGTRIVQFRDFPEGYDFYAQGTSLKVLFRGCRWRWPNGGVGGAGLFNDNGSTSSQQIMMHYCDLGMAADIATGAAGLLHVKNLGGLNHRFLRNHHTHSSTFYQPNTQGCWYQENWIDKYSFFYGESGESGAFDTSVYHNNGISCEGGLTSITIIRNHILCPSPDGSTGVNGSAAGQSGYGTQPGQTGYGNGTNPGRLVGQTDCIALFNSNGLANQGTSAGAILVQDNYLGGSGVSLYAGDEGVGGGGQNIHVIGNKFSTRWWTNSGQFGPVTAQPPWGTNGNFQSGNVWADDYGTGGNGSTAVADRQYPAGNGPRAGTSVI